ncbi:hypothetical protein FHX48_001075 [Microbacterium halimionae]|uniref:LPXTG cell wall anchor domain-containing protein n=1 Tax=Microbacterium halimionae TaxID=1526413 RepID=A0A7W3JNB7_9MICO|nr:hypothetical protein [Microbacterium halimionae]MBA8816002.1 hypothetical protein [Microbacterium halimionae]NII96205.1 hypothetical protein [Microbacterium halimionae]
MVAPMPGMPWRRAAGFAVLVAAMIGGAGYALGRRRNRARD